MTEAEGRRELSRILSDLAEELDVSPSKYKDARQRYDAVGGWLNEEDSELAPYSPTIYPQGSFALGTAIRPWGDGEYDVDAVCVLQLRQGQISQQRLKGMVGDRLKAHKLYARMLDPKDGGRRCWTLKYADGSNFHMDILPAIPDEYGWLVALGVPREQAKHAICITDKKSWLTQAAWPKSNPQGYVDWFKSRMRTILEERRRLVALEKQADVQEVPDYEIRTPLQQVVQLLKRHRDIRYNGDDDKPITIIISTLAAQVYNNEANLVDAVQNVIPSMRRAIENRDGVWWVPNPINPRENFADRWGERPRKAKIFLEWLTAVEHEHQELITERGIDKISEYLAKSYGQPESSVAMAKFANRTSHKRATNAAKAIAIAANSVPSRFNVPHRERPRWPVVPRYEVRLAARASREGFRTIHFNSDPAPLAKHFSLRFEASTTVPQPFEVYWQVVNTGEEATRGNGMRGSIFSGDLFRRESTLYKGMHWIECFIIKDGRCVARSGEFVVNIV